MSDTPNKPVMRLSVLVACLGLGLAASQPLLAVDLVGVHDTAVENDPQLQAASYRRDATGENKRQAVANLLPSLSGGVAYTRGNNQTEIAGVEVSDNDVDTENLSLDLNQPLYRQANFEILDRSKAEVAQAEANYSAAYQDFLLRVTERYFAVLTAQDTVIFAEAEEKALQRQFEQAEQRFEVGLTAVTDVHEARASYDNARARGIVARNDLEDTKEALKELTGRYFEDLDVLKEELPLQAPDPANPEDWVELAVANNPNLVSSQRQVDIADSNVSLQRAGHFPTLDLVASYGDFTNNEYALFNDLGEQFDVVDLTQDSWSVGLRLNVPIYEGGAVSSRTRQAAYIYQATVQDYEQQYRATVRETENAYRAVIAGTQEVDAFHQAVVSAQSALDATQAGFEVGTRTIVDVLIAEQRFYSAQRDYSRARHAYIVNHLRLKQSAGVLGQEDLVAVNTLLE